MTSESPLGDEVSGVLLSSSVAAMTGKRPTRQTGPPAARSSRQAQPKTAQANRSAIPGSRSSRAVAKTTGKPTAAKGTINKTATGKAAAGKSAARKKASPRRAKGEVRLLAGGNPQIAKGEGDAPVQAYIAALSGWKRELAAQLDQLITEVVPGVQKAVKWNSPFYGVEGEGWFLGVHTFTRYLKVNFFQGASLRPLPPVASSSGEVRYVHLSDQQPFDASQLADWIRQAAAIPGWKIGG